MTKVSDILLTVNFKKRVDSSFVRHIFEIMLRRGCRIYVFQDEAELFREIGVSAFSVIDFDLSVKQPDMLIVLGGDGSIIRASSKTSELEIPILGINFGTVGYLAELEAGDTDKIEKILDGCYDIDERMMLNAEILRGGSTVYTARNVLNDIVLSNGPVARLLNFDVTVNGVLMQKYRADGMIAATPTGSTAYSMSAGGPIMDPCLDAVCITPICSHSLSDRPVIVPGDTVIGIENIDTEDDSVYITVDGRHMERLEPEDKIRIFRSKSHAKLVRTTNNSFISVLNSKL